MMIKTPAFRKYLLLTSLMLFGLATVALADPPARVGRLNYISGEVSFRPADLDDWAAASINYPLTTGDHIWTDDQSRAELHIGSTVVRLGDHTALNFLNVDDNIVQLRLSEGELSVHLIRLAPDDAFEIDTPNGAISLLRPGIYRIDVNNGGDKTIVTVREGEAEATGGGYAFSVKYNETGVVRGTEYPEYNIDTAYGRDDLDNWCLARDRREEQVASTRYINREWIGYEDLDDYGHWRNTPDYGWVWVPSRVQADWAPYRYGHWAWIEPWGWTWIDDAPWGFAPFHYGRWTYVGGGWAWIPGPVIARPVYAPALVAFVGGNGWHVGVGVGVGWFPLGPREVYVPPYRASTVYLRNVNITNVRVTNINVTNVTYVNRTVPGAVTVVRQSDFVGSRSVGRVVVNVSNREIVEAPVVGHTAFVAPQRESVLATGSVSRVAVHPPTEVINRHVVAKTTPPAPIVPFSQKQQVLNANPGRPIDPSTLSTMRRDSITTSNQVRVVSGGNRHDAHNGTQNSGSTTNNGSSTANPAANRGDQKPMNDMRNSNRPSPAAQPKVSTQTNTTNSNKTNSSTTNSNTKTDNNDRPHPRTDTKTNENDDHRTPRTDDGTKSATGTGRASTDKSTVNKDVNTPKNERKTDEKDKSKESSKGSDKDKGKSNSKDSDKPKSKDGNLHFG
ncbi:MAG TPA: DUF6600 domain-containing protein [Blastocatellia bacterium]|nr:DUF6600 domain-containing protein [Blastocatellia bacterium]